MMISICMATYNGQEFLREQIDSILCQLSLEDELVISDDHSTDDTIKIIKSYSDNRIKLFSNNLPKGVTHNFENALIHSSGDLIFFSDQDDVWFPEKLDKMSRFLIDGGYDVVTCNCSLATADLQIIKEKHFDEHWPMKKTVLQNIIQNAWLGSCMAFRRKVLYIALPFPQKVVAHDLWLALFAQMHCKCGYMPDVLQLYRRHSKTVSFTGSKSTNSLYFKVSYRIYLVVYLLWESIKRSRTLRNVSSLQ